jgi:inosine-uridine nucleoside N-ribohydrolase
MEKSYSEILKLISLMKKDALKERVYRGSRSYLPDEMTPVYSDAAEHLAKLAMTYTPENPLYVVAIGAITNVASALLINPQIASRIVVVWLGGHSFEWPDAKEFNMYQDVAAARVIFGSEAPVVMLPCMGVVSSFRLSGDDLRARFFGKNDISTYLTENTEKAVSTYVPSGKAWSRIIWDVTAVAWLTSRKNGADRFTRYRIVPAPICEYNNTYSFNNNMKKIAYVYHIDRDALLNDLIDKLTN